MLALNDTHDTFTQCHTTLRLHMHLWKECSMLERMWLIFLTVSYVLLYGFGQISLLTTATALMGSICARRRIKVSGQDWARV